MIRWKLERARVELAEARALANVFVLAPGRARLVEASIGAALAEVEDAITVCAEDERTCDTVRWPEPGAIELRSATDALREAWREADRSTVLERMRPAARCIADTTMALLLAIESGERGAPYVSALHRAAKKVLNTFIFGRKGST
jgi:hypothetical protein